MPIISAGIDLAGSERRPTGIAIITKKLAVLYVAYTNHQVLSFLSKFKPEIVAIDAPLTKPIKGKAIRTVDKLMMSLGFKVLPPGFPGMMKLTERGIKLKDTLERKGIEVLETHPSSAIRALGFKNRGEFLSLLINAEFLVEGQVNDHTIDALIAAYTALSYIGGKSFYVKSHDGEIVLPVPKATKKTFSYSRHFRLMNKRYPKVAVDVVVLDGEKVVLVKRLNEPYKNYWALPGGFVEYGETVEQAAIREAKEETGLDVKLLTLVGVYSDPKRDPRGHVISITFLATVTGGELKASTDAKEVKAFNVNKLPKRLAFDHTTILKDSLELARKLNYLRTPIA